MNFFSKLFKKDSKEKTLLKELLKVIRQDVKDKKRMTYPGMCYYIHKIADGNEINTLHRLIYDNAPPIRERVMDVYLFPMYEFKPREEFLLDLIKKY